MRERGREGGRERGERERRGVMGGMRRERHW
jgi:hypothetical protein